MTDVIKATGLVKRFGKVQALDGLDLRVPQGCVLGLLGPNGAGKTTAVRIITTLLRPSAGQVSINDIDVLRHPNRVRHLIGLSGQYAAVDEHLTGAENLQMVGRLYGMPNKKAKARAHELLERFNLEQASNRPCKTYSGGMRRRLDLAAALVASPPVLVLDEPTTGLDPRSRMQMWDVIRDLVASGSTLLLTTQYLEEADRLADQIMVIDKGRCIAQGSADQLKEQIGGQRIEVILAHQHDSERARQIIGQITGENTWLDETQRQISSPAPQGAPTLLAVLRRLDEAGITLTDIGLRRPTLDEVFITLTGHDAEEGLGALDETADTASPAEKEQ